jgi:tight adherence protein B
LEVGVKLLLGSLGGLGIGIGLFFAWDLLFGNGLLARDKGPGIKGNDAFSLGNEEVFENGGMVRESIQTSPAKPLGLPFVRLGLAVGVAALVFLFSRWPVAALLAGLGAWALPLMLADKSGRREIQRVEAVATWTEMLRDTMAASAGLSQALMATAPLAPRLIRPHVEELTSRVKAGEPLEIGLERLGRQLNDSTGDLVVAALMLSARARASRLKDLLGTLADHAREEVSMRLRIETSRASIRSGVRVVSVFSIGFALALLLLAHSYLSPFGTPVGQLVLAAVGCLYAGGLWLLRFMAKPAPELRILEAGGETP